jgi:hypothetical protein
LAGLTADRSRPMKSINVAMAVIAWEIEAPTGVRRPLIKVSPLIADSLLDCFEIRLISGVSLPA